MKRIGLIAGGGRWPFVFISAAKAAGYEVVTAGVEGAADPGLAGFSARFRLINPGQMGEFIAFFKDEQVTEVVMAGKVEKSALFTARLDETAKQALGKLPDRGDNAILTGIAGLLAEAGIAVKDPVSFAGPVLAPAGPLGRRGPTPEEQQDIEFGKKICRETGRQDIGQAVIVKQRSVVAVEAMEGTDETIRRSGQLAGPGAVVVKLSKPGQDLRFDLPAIGPETIRAMKEAGASCLAVESGRTIILDRDEVIHLADSADICIIGV